MSFLSLTSACLGQINPKWAKKVARKTHGIKLIGLAFKRVILLKRLKLRLSQCTGVTNWINTKAPTANIRLEDILARTSTKDYPAAEAVYHHMEMIFESKGKILNLIPGRNRKPLLIVWD